MATDADLDGWDELVDRSPQGSAHHRLGWLRAVERAYGQRLVPLVVLQGARPAAVFPVFVRRTYGVRTVSSPPPRSLIEYLGPAFLPPPAASQTEQERFVTACITAAVEFVREAYRFDALSVKAALPAGGARAFGWQGMQVSPLYTYHLHLGRPLEAVRSGISKSVRKFITRAAKLEFDFREADDYADVLRIYESVCRRYAEQGMGAPYTEAYLRELWSNLGGRELRAFVVEHEGAFVIGRIAALHRGVLSAISGAPRTTYLDVPVNDFLHWKVIEWCVANDVTTYNLVGGNTRSIAEYKMKLGPTLAEYYAIRHDNLRGRVARQLYHRLRRTAGTSGGSPE